MKRLWRSRENKVITGLLGGIGEYFDIDPAILRVGYVFLTIFTGIFPGIIAYLIASLAVPERPAKVEAEKLDVIEIA